MSTVIELRSRNAIKRAIQALREGDYEKDKSLYIAFDEPFFSTIVDEDIKADLEEMMSLLPLQLSFLGLKPVVDNGDNLTSVWKCLVPVEVVMWAFVRTRSLDTINISHLVLVGSKMKFQQFADVIKDHHKLSFATLKCESREGTMPAANIDEECKILSYLDPVIGALGSLKTMQDVRLNDWRGHVFRPALGNDALNSICGLPKLKTLVLYNFCITDKHLVAMAKLLREKASLCALYIQCRHLGDEGSDALRQMIRENKSITTLGVYVESVQDESSGGDLLGGVIREITGAKCTKLFLAAPDKMCPQVRDFALQMMRCNYTIKDLSMRKFVRKNDQYLQYIQKDSEIDFLVKTNKLGRGQLFQEETEGSGESMTWLKMLDATEYDLTNIFYLVKSNPLKFVYLLQNDWAQKQIPDKEAMDKLLKSNNKAAAKDVRKIVEEASEKQTQSVEQCERTIRALQVSNEKQGRSIEQAVETIKTLQVALENQAQSIEQSDKTIKALQVAVDKQVGKKDWVVRFLLFGCFCLVLSVQRMMVGVINDRQPMAATPSGANIPVQVELPAPSEAFAVITASAGADRLLDQAGLVFDSKSDFIVDFALAGVDLIGKGIEVQAVTPRQIAPEHVPFDANGVADASTTVESDEFTQRKKENLRDGEYQMVFVENSEDGVVTE